jgi:putative spermidine/putrescine transport system substrate-binding protein
MKRVIGIVFLASLAGLMSSVATAQTTALRGTQLNFAGFGGVLEEAEIKSWVKPFQEATGATVRTTSPVSYARIKAQVEAGNVIEDIAHVDAFFVQANCGTLFEKIDTAALVAIGIRKEYITNQCGLPTTAASMLIAYNKDTFGDSPPTGWVDFFDTKKFPGRRALWNFVQNGLLEAALLADGVAPDKLYPLDLDRAFAKLDTIKDELQWVQSPAGLTEALLNEDVDLALSFSGRAYAAARDGAPIDQVREQQIQFWDGVGIVKGTKNLEAAKAFLNFGARPEVQARFVEVSAYGATNKNAAPNIDDLITSYLPLNKDTAPTAIYLDQNWWAENFDMANQRFVDWQSR